MKTNSLSPSLSLSLYIYIYIYIYICSATTRNGSATAGNPSGAFPYARRSCGPRGHQNRTWHQPPRLSPKRCNRPRFNDAYTIFILYFGIILVSLWDHSGIILGSLWGHCGSFWDHFGIILGSFGDHFGVNFASFQNHPEITLGRF